MTEFNRRKKIHPCRITKDDLVRLIPIVKSDFLTSTRKEDFVISATLNNISISENTLEEFLNHDRLPKILTRLSILMIGRSDKKDFDIDKSVQLTFFESFIDLTVSGSS